jgi:hypothetical protein
MKDEKLCVFLRKKIAFIHRLPEGARVERGVINGSWLACLLGEGVTGRLGAGVR